MNLLLDTSAFLWMALSPEYLSERARKLLSESNHQLFLSPLSFAEISIKYNKKKLHLALPPELFVPRFKEAHDIKSLPFEDKSAEQITKLPLLHHDPFDRMLIAQAIAHGMPIVTNDPFITRYPVRVEW